MQSKGKHVRAQDSQDAQVRFGRVARRSLAELAAFNVTISAAVALVLLALGKAARWLLASKGVALTTANASQVLLSWQGLLLIGISILVAAFYVGLELFAHIYFCKGLLEGEEGGLYPRIGRALRDGVKGLARFVSPSGLPTLIYIVLLAPLVGVGFSVGLTKDFYVPHFIMDVIQATPLYAVLYSVFLLVMAAVGILHFFTVHGVLLDNLTPAQARIRSRQIVRGNARLLVQKALKAFLIIAAITAVLFFCVLAFYVALIVSGAGLPTGYRVDFVELVGQGDQGSDTAWALVLYRGACFFLALASFGIAGLAALLAASCTMLYSIHLYRWLSAGNAEEPRYPSRKPIGFRALFARLFLIGLVFALLSFVLGAFYDVIVDETGQTEVVAHRLGGSAAPENSIQGLEYAIEKGCYGAETDTQRTKDGHYIINHDDSFARLTGTDAMPQDLTLAEIKQLRLTDPLFPETELEVPTLEELIDVAKGRIKLFIELKGATADRQMVDDVVRMVRERDAVDDVVLISLNGDCIDYAEETYPEFRCGLLFFAQYGDITLIDCDILLAEEEIATTEFISEAHLKEREVGVWTANTESDLHKVLAGSADYVITDKIDLAESVQQELDARSDIEAIFEFIWGLG